MTKSNKTGHYSRLILLTVFIIILGFASCRRDDEGTVDAWKYVGDLKGEKSQQISVYIDVNNMVVEDNVRQFWIRYYNSKSPGSDEKYISQIGHWEVNCTNRDLFVLGEEYYGPDARLLGKSEERKKEEYKEGTLGDKLSAIACRYAGKTN